MIKRQRNKSAFSHQKIAEQIRLSQQRVSFMLRNPSQGQNRQRLLTALIEMGLNNEAAERFINSNFEK